MRSRKHGEVCDVLDAWAVFERVRSMRARLCTKSKEHRVNRHRGRFDQVARRVDPSGSTVVLSSRDV